MVYEQVAVHVGDLRDAIIPEDGGIADLHSVCSREFRLGSLDQAELGAASAKTGDDNLIGERPLFRSLEEGLFCAFR